MKYYSELTKKIYDDAEACAQAEKEHIAAEDAARKKAETERAEKKALAKEIEDLLKQHDELGKQISERIVTFNEKYGPFHYTIRDSRDHVSLFDLLDFLI